MKRATMADEDPYFEIGDRIRLSALGRSRMTRMRSTTGKVVGFGRSDTIFRIFFDGANYPVSIHHSYLERDLQPLPKSPRGSRGD